LSVRSHGVAPAETRGRTNRRPRLEVAAPRLPFEVAEAKVRIPALRPDMVSRTSLVNRLRAATVPVAVCTSPAGYGKTTLLVQWASRDPRPFAWVSVDERDNDPRVLLQDVAAALHQIEPLSDPVLKALRSRESMWTRALPRLASTLAASPRPFVLVLDDADLLDGDSAKLVSVLVDHVPRGSMLVLAGRVAPPVRLARLRASGLVLEIETDGLAMSPRETKLMLQNAHAEPSDSEADDLVLRAEGWAAGVYLMTLAFTEGRGAHSAAALRGDDRYVAEYLRAEHLADLAPRQREFLRRTSVLERMCGPLCDAVLDRSGSARELLSIERSNLFIVPLDGHGEWFRYHHLFQDLLGRELAEREPGLIATLNRRAADWLEANGRPEEALPHAFASGSPTRAARIFTAIVMPAYNAGRVADAEAWLTRFDDDELLERLPGVAVHGSRIHALRGRAVEAERWLAAAERRVARTPRARDTSVAAAAAVVRALLAVDGVDRMRADAEFALAKLPPTTQWRPLALLIHAVALVLACDEGADAAFEEAAHAAARMGNTEALVIALMQRALLAAERGDTAAADELASSTEQIVEKHGIEEYAGSALRMAVSARAHLRAGRWQHARADLDAAQRLLPRLEALPWLAAQTRLELARAHLATRESVEAQALLAEAESLLKNRVGFDALKRECAQLRGDVRNVGPAPDGRSSGLTDAELRLLPLLATHLSFREIGERLFVSRNTIKTQAISVYRKLRVSNRSDAVERAAELGLVPGLSAPSSRTDEELLETAR
jgi:LuxR family transcriptional regulator, maltose regulon positive regulatory protein